MSLSPCEWTCTAHLSSPAPASRSLPKELSSPAMKNEWDGKGIFKIPCKDYSCLVNSHVWHLSAFPRAERCFFLARGCRVGVSASPGSWKEMGAVSQTKQTLSSNRVIHLKGFICSFVTLKLVWLYICKDFFLLKLIYLVRKSKKVCRPLCKYYWISQVTINPTFSKAHFYH